MGRRRLEEIRKKEILDALIRVVSENGASGASIRSVANEVGCSHAMITHYVSSKAELFLLGVEHLLSLYDQKIPYRGAEAGSAREALEVFVRLYLSLASEKSGGVGRAWLEFCLLANESEGIRAAIDRGLKRGQKAVARIVKDGIKANEFRPVDANEFARALLALLEGANLLRISSGVFTEKQGETAAMGMVASLLAD